MRKARIDDEEDDRRIVPDGGQVFVPLELMDSVQRATFDACYGYRPGFARLTDAQILRRRLAREQMIKTACDAWKMGRDQKPDNDDPDTDDPDDDLSPYEIYKRDLQNAWKTNRGVVGAGPATVGPNNRWAGPGAPATDSRRLLTRDEANTMRNTAYKEYCDRLYSAWKTR